MFLESGGWPESKNTLTPNSSNKKDFSRNLGGIHFFSSTCGQNMSLYGQILLPKQ